MTARVLLLLPLLGFLANCTEPAVMPKAPAFQDSAVTARDWATVAAEIADEMAARGLLPNPLAAHPAPPPAYAYYVRVAAPDSRFLHAVARDLQSEILHRGGTVTVSPVGAMVINLDVDVVRWSGEHYPGGTGTIAGLAAGTGILLANAAPLTPAAGFGIVSGAGIVSDLLAATTPHTNVEAVWQASAILGDRLAFDITRPIYVGAGDAPLYTSKLHLAAMASPGERNTAPVVRLRYAP
jgi:hypothetical protein